MKTDIRLLEKEIGRNFVHDAIVRGVIIVFLCIAVAIAVSMLSIYNLPPDLQFKAIATAIAVPIITAPPAIAYVTRQDFKSLKLMQEVVRLALTDEMTDLSNRRAFMRDAQSRIQGHDYSASRLAFLLIDLDHFKTINDRFGHNAGDKALIQTANTMREALKDDDLLARLGGEEFVAVVECLSTKQLNAVAEGLRQAVANTPYFHGSREINVTISIGIGIAAKNSATVSDVLSQADHALYEAKNTGRNRHVLAA